MTEPEQWEKDLREAGWKPYRFHGRRETKMMWVAPDGNIYRGPYGAWRMMQSQRQWSCDSPDDGCYECGGEGWVENECFEDTCCCADPDLSHGIRPCSLCNPGGTR